ncbi:MAG TPA: proline racemase family protein [Candidatus Limiplasma sp.]|nr:proline racemase family protein [Candidatus Limiplasma sp.]
MDCFAALTKAEKTFLVVDSHTMGEPTRIILDGFPPLEGQTMMERKQFLCQHYDHYRTALMLEPRGHKDMFGALVTRPLHPEADLGVIFMENSGYLNMCGHGSIGTATVAVETGLVKVEEPYTWLTLDAPAGLVRARVRVENGRAKEVTLVNVPAFLYREGLPVPVPDYGTVVCDIAFGGSFFALVDAAKVGLAIDNAHLPALTELGMRLMATINETFPVRHPEMDIHGVDLVEFFSATDNPNANMKNVVIFGDRQIDRSPCGTGTSAKLACLYRKGLIGIQQPFTYESITGSLFKGVVAGEATVGAYPAVIPEITGSAYITGVNQLILNSDDPKKYGFLVGGVAN